MAVYGNPRPWEIPMHYSSHDVDPSLEPPRLPNAESDPGLPQERSADEVQSLIDRDPEDRSEGTARALSRPIEGLADTSPLVYRRAGSMDQVLDLPDTDEMDAPSHYVPAPKETVVPEWNPLLDENRRLAAEIERLKAANPWGEVPGSGMTQIDPASDKNLKAAVHSYVTEREPAASAALSKVLPVNNHISLLKIVPAKGGARVWIRCGHVEFDMGAPELESMARQFTAWSDLARMIECP